MWEIKIIDNTCCGYIKYTYTTVKGLNFNINVNIYNLFGLISGYM